jgi:hypothetical protein
MDYAAMVQRLMAQRQPQQQQAPEPPLQYQSQFDQMQPRMQNSGFRPNVFGHNPTGSFQRPQPYLVNSMSDLGQRQR